MIFVVHLGVITNYSCTRKEKIMNIFTRVFFAICLCALPVTVAYAQVPSIKTEMKQLLVNINTADAKQLTKLPGIGEKKAKAIVKYREMKGNFTSMSDLEKVKGIGKKLITKLEGKVAF